MFKVYDGEKANELFLKLTPGYGGAVDLELVDSDGDTEWQVLTIEANGTVTIHEDIDSDAGLRTDCHGAVVVNDYTRD